MGRRIIALLVGIGCVGAIAMVALCINDWLHQRHQREEYLLRLQSQMEALDAVRLERNRNLARWYNFNLENGNRDMESYETILSFHGDLGWMILPGNQALPIHHGGSDEIWGAVHDPASAFPLGAGGEHTVLRLPEEPKQAKPGRIVEVNYLDACILYQIEEITEEVPEPFWQEDALGLTLLAPGEVGTIVIRCQRIEAMPENVPEEKENISAAAIWMAAVGAAVFPAAVWWLDENLMKLRKSQKNIIKTIKPTKKRKNHERMRG